MKRFSLLLFSLTCMVISFAQNVGIGTSTPAYPLTVVSDGLNKGITQKNNSVELGFYVSGIDAFLQTWTPHNLNFATNNGSAKMTLSNTNGYVGIGNAAPAEPLDVTGNINVTGTIKANGVDGTTGQVLMRGNSGIAWGSVNTADYAHVAGFRSTGVSTTNTSYSWNVPAGVTKMFVEAWGGGGGGSSFGGGGGGGYSAVEWSVAPGAAVAITIGAAGAAAPNGTSTGSYGNNTVVEVNSLVQLIAEGGGGGSLSNGGFPGGFTTNAGTGFNIFGESGTPGETNRETYGQYSSTVYYTSIQYGSGGNGGNTSHRQNNGGFRSYNTSNNNVIKVGTPMIGSEPGGGGGGGSTPREGGPGMVIIHY